MTTDSHGKHRGRRARSPRELPAKGWKDVLLRVKEELAEDGLSMLAAGIGFYALLALFPALIAAVSIYGLVADPADVEAQVASLAEVMPASARDLLATQLHDIVASSETNLGLGVAVSILVALWSAAKGAKAIVAGVNVAYDEEETRGFVAQNVLALGLTLGAVVFGVVAIAIIAVAPSLLGRWGLSTAGVIAVELGRWIVLLGGGLVALAVVYRYAPDRDHPRWRWVSVGSVVASVLWLVASMLFSWYAASFGSFNESYGSLAGVVVLLLWLQISAFAVLLGAEVNAEIEHQTAVDSTVGTPEPMGRRGAVKADSLGEAKA